MVIDTKKCRKCAEVKPLTAFYPNKECRLGVIGTCKECQYEYLRPYYAANKDKRNDYATTRNQRRKKEVVDKFGDKCLDCGNTYPQYVYQFHHLDPTKKDVNPSHVISKRPTTMWAELDKCVMLCANCHMIRHHKENHG